MQRAILDTQLCFWKKFLVQILLKLGKIGGAKFPRKLRFPVKRSRIRPMHSQPLTHREYCVSLCQMSQVNILYCYTRNIYQCCVENVHKHDE